MRILRESGLLNRSPEAAWVFHREVYDGLGAPVIYGVIAQFAPNSGRLAAVLNRLTEAKVDPYHKAEP